MKPKMPAKPGKQAPAKMPGKAPAKGKQMPPWMQGKQG